MEKPLDRKKKNNCLQNIYDKNSYTFLKHRKTVKNKKNDNKHDFLGQIDYWIRCLCHFVFGLVIEEQ